jgi:hypothetical protein
VGSRDERTGEAGGEDLDEETGGSRVMVLQSEEAGSHVPDTRPRASLARARPVMSSFDGIAHAAFIGEDVRSSTLPLKQPPACP